MGSNSTNKVSQIIEIDDDVIDLDDTDNTTEEVIYEWDAKIRRKLSTFTVADNQYVLGDLMKEYLESLQEMATSYEDNETLKNKVLSHISFLYLYYVELQCCTPDSYLIIMEDILTVFCNLVLEVIRPLNKKDFTKQKYKKQIVSTAGQTIYVLTVYLLERHDHILHVLIKMNTNKAEPCKEVLNILYTHFLTKVTAFNLSDESFCRTYIVFQKWKEIRTSEEWEGMDKIMYKMFKRTPESITNSNTLKQILLPKSDSTVVIIRNLFNSYGGITGSYFKHVVAKNVEVDDLLLNIDLGEDEPTLSVNDDNEECQFEKAYYELERNMSNLSHMNGVDSVEIDIFRRCKEEFDEDDDVQFVSITRLPEPPVVEIGIEESNYRMINTSNKYHNATSTSSIQPSPILVNSTREKTGNDFPNFNGITRIRVGSPRTVPDTPDSCQPMQVPVPDQPMEVPVAAQPMEVPASVQPMEIPVPVKPVETPVPAQTIEVAVPARPMEIPVPTRPMEIPVPTRPMEVVVPARPVEIPVPARSTEIPVEVPVPVQPMEIPVSVQPVEIPVLVQPVESPVSVQPVEIPVPVQPVEIPVPVQAVEISVPVQPMEVPVRNQPVEVPGLAPETPQPSPQPVVKVMTTETNQPKVSFVSINTPETNPSSPTNALEPVCDTTSSTKPIEVKSVEVQATNVKDYLYNDYGLTTPPFDAPTDEQISRPVEPRLYAQMGHSVKRDIEKEKSVATRSVEVQVDPPSKSCPYNDYGLTPPNDTHLEDHNVRLQEPLYTNIGQKDLGSKVNATFSESISAHSTETTPDEIAQENSVMETENQTDDEYSKQEETRETLAEAADSEFDELDNQLEISEETNIEEYDTEEIDVESCSEPDKDSPLVPEIPSDGPSVITSSEESAGFKTSDQIDTGQKTILNSAPNIPSPVTAESEINPSELYNGNTILKPLVSSNRTNGQSKDNTSTKIMYTSSQRIRPTSLDDFSRFESAIHNQWNKMKETHDFDDIYSGPVSKVLPVKQTTLLTTQDKLDLFSSEVHKPVPTNSRSNSPTDMTSPDYEAIDDFRNYFSDSVNGRVPPPHDVKVPPGILKKNNTTRKKNYRIMFHESTCDHSEERKTRGNGILVPKRVRRDRKLNMNPRVVVERLSFIENIVKRYKILEENSMKNSPLLRIDYDKTTPYLNENDVVRCNSPPKFSWVISVSLNSHNQGKVKKPKYTSYSKKASSKCENSPCCNQLAEEFKLNCNVCEEKALNLTIPEPPPVNPESEFSNSPTFLQGTDELLQHCLEETETFAEDVKKDSSLLCDNSNFYNSLNVGNDLNKNLTNDKTSSISVESNSKSDSGLKESVDDTLLQLPTAVPESYDFEKNLKNEVFSKIDWQNFEDSDGETRLPLKKRKLSVVNNNEREEEKKEEISYPATPMISIAEVEALHPRKLQPNTSRPFKTPAERKEMPPLPVFYNVDSDPSPIITDQFNINNHTYNNPTINYHMNNVPVPFINIPCGSYYSLPPILVPFNNVSNFDQGKIPQQEAYVKKETRKQGRQRRRH